jgi:hypothetical protein
MQTNTTVELNRPSSISHPVDLIRVNWARLYPKMRWIKLAHQLSRRVAGVYSMSISTTGILTPELTTYQLLHLNLFVLSACLRTNPSLSRSSVTQSATRYANLLSLAQLQRSIRVPNNAELLTVLRCLKRTSMKSTQSESLNRATQNGRLGCWQKMYGCTRAPS